MKVAYLFGAAVVMAPVFLSSGYGTARADGAARMQFATAITAIVIAPDGRARLEGVGPPKATVAVRSGAAMLGQAEVSPAGTWALDVGTGLRARDHRFGVMTVGGGIAGHARAGGVRVSIPESFVGRLAIAHDRDHVANARSAHAASPLPEAVRADAEALAAAATTTSSNVLLSARYAQIAQADAPVQVEREPQPATGAPRQSAVPENDFLAPVMEWLERSSRTYQDVIVRRLSEDETHPHAAQVRPQESRPPHEEDAAAGRGVLDRVVRSYEAAKFNLQEWLARANRTYHDEIVRPLSQPGVTTPAEFARGENVRRAAPAPTGDASASQEEDRAAKVAETARRLADGARDRGGETTAGDADGDMAQRQADLKAAEDRRIEAQRLAEEKAAAEAARAAKAAEEERLAALKRQQEEAAAARREEERRKAEAARAEDQRLARERAEAEAVATRQAEERRLAEERRKAAEVKGAEEERLAALKRQQEEAEAARREEERRKAEAARAEEQRLARERAEAKAEAARQAEERRLAEERRRAEEAKAAEEERRAALKRKQQEEEATRRAEARAAQEKAAKAEAARKAAAVAKRLEEARQAQMQADEARRAQELEEHERLAAAAEEAGEAEKTARRAEAAPKAAQPREHEAGDERRVRPQPQGETRRSETGQRHAAEDDTERVARAAPARRTRSSSRRRAGRSSLGATRHRAHKTRSARVRHTGRRHVHRSRHAGKTHRRRWASAHHGRHRTRRVVRRKAVWRGRTIRYVVRRGDTLSRIARRYYGSARKYRIIYRANRRRIRHPDFIRRGQTILIPCIRR